jgi:predicted metalloprotease with PDZ domain
MHFFRISAGIAASIFLSVPGIFARGEQRDGPPPVIHYQLTVDSADLSGYTVEINIRHAPEHFQLAMATHPEYDDRFWRFVKDFQVTVPAGKGGYSRKDSAVWDLSIPGDEAVIRYRIQIPTTSRYAHRPFLSPGGGLVGDLHSFMYIVGQIHIPSPVTFRLPEGWQIATGLERTAGNNAFIASSAVTLMDCPALIGRLREWRFMMQGIPYTVAYLSVAGRLAFDTALLVASIQKIVKQAVDLFGSTPYKAYTFLLEDGVYGALEHGNSVTIGAPASLLADHMPDIYGEITHEFFHSWNLVSIRPAEYTELNNGPRNSRPDFGSAKGCLCSTPICCSAGPAFPPKTPPARRISKA